MGTVGRRVRYSAVPDTPTTRHYTPSSSSAATGAMTADLPAIPGSDDADAIRGENLRAMALFALCPGLPLSLAGFSCCEIARLINWCFDNADRARSREAVELHWASFARRATNRSIAGAACAQPAAAKVARQTDSAELAQ